MKPVKIKNNRNIFGKRRRRNSMEFIALSALLVLLLTALYIKWNHDNKIVPNAEDNKPKVTEQQPAKAEKEEKEDSNVVLPVEIDEEGKVVEEDDKYVPAEPETIVTSDGTVVEVIDGPPMHGPENPVIYTVQDGDTLWDIAELVYGDGEMWTELWDANADALIHYDARNTLEQGHWIHPGTDIIIPGLSADH
jgi:nucleoid-associated protein YgaU